MLQKPQTPRRALLGYALVMPLAGLLALCTQPDRDVAQTERPAIIHQPARQAGIDGKIFTVVEEQPEFLGGNKKLGEFLGQNLKYPAAAEKANVSGKVFVSFIVTKSGDVADVKILKGIGFGADEEATRVVSKMPRWIPGKQDGKAVNVRYYLPINFQLEEDGKGELEDVNEKTTFFSVPTGGADIHKQYKHFVVDGKEVSFDEFRKQDKAGIIEGSSSQQTIRIQTLPPPPPVDPSDASVYRDIKHFTIDGAQTTLKSVLALSPREIASMNVDKQQGTMAIITK